MLLHFEKKAIKVLSITFLGAFIWIKLYYNHLYCSSFSCAEINKMELLLANEKGDIGDELIDLGIAEKKRVTWNYSYRTVKYYPG